MEDQAILVPCLLCSDRGRVPWPAVVSSTVVSKVGVTALRNLPPGYRGRVVSPTDEHTVEPTTWCQSSRPRDSCCFPLPLSPSAIQFLLLHLQYQPTTTCAIHYSASTLLSSSSSLVHLFHCLPLAQGVRHPYVGGNFGNFRFANPEPTTPNWSDFLE